MYTMRAVVMYDANANITLMNATATATAAAVKTARTTRPPPAPRAAAASSLILCASSGSASIAARLATSSSLFIAARLAAAYPSPDAFDGYVGISRFSFGGGCSAKNACVDASSAVTRRFGSYARSLFRRSNPRSLTHGPPFGDIFGNFLRSWLYGCWRAVVSFFAAGRDGKSGQIFSFGVPNSLKILSTWSVSVFPWNSGSFPSNSPMMHPKLHTSIAVSYIFVPSNNSGALYHKVTTTRVYARSGSLYCRAKPKSQIFSSPRLFTRTFDVFKSR